MTLNIGYTISNGLKRVGNRNGGLLIILAALIGVVWQITVISVFAQLLPPEVSGSFGLALKIPLVMLVVGGIIVFFLLSYITIVATRTFVAGKTEKIPREFLQRRIPWVIANLIVGGVVFGFLTLLGTLLLVIPGIIVYLSLLFMTIYIVVEDENFISAMKDSWNLTRGHWLRLFLLIVIILVPLMIVSTGLSTGISMITGSNPVISQLLSGLITMPLSIVMLGILAEAFTQLRQES